MLCVGAGGLGSPASLYLAAAGVGTLGLVDFDVGRLQQPAAADPLRHRRTSAGRSSRRRADRLHGAQPGRAASSTHETRADVRRTRSRSSRTYDIIVDGTDNFPTRYLVNDACVLLGKPNVYGSIFRFDGQASVFATKGGPCYRCLYPEPPPPGLVPSCAEGGVLGVLPGIIGTIQATEAIKLILGAGEPLVGRLLLFDALAMKFRELKLRRDPDVPGLRRPSDDHGADRLRAVLRRRAGGAGRGRGRPRRRSRPTVEELKARLDRGDASWILDVREPHEFDICRIPGSTLIPLGELPKRLAEIPSGPDAPDIVVHCKMGGRSAKAVALLREHGFTRVQNLTGGILAWTAKIDPSVPTY